ncbi:MAG: aminotransferase class I/II-fold pyridoxal phosphate-dependent enzyme [Spirochaetales bacterium]|nr:aminotransferase class I/II-fold pyridoxal phosphate-dependent enzyme [Spirochaetales bacterium]
MKRNTTHGIPAEKTGNGGKAALKDLFDKCHKFSRADEAKALGYYPYFRELEENEGPEVTIEGKRLVMAGSNNYLGLSVHPEVKKAAVDAIEKYGSTCSGSRYLNGTLALHHRLEDAIAEFIGVDSCLCFTSGYVTNQGIIPTLVGRHEYLLSDKDNHTSIVAGTLMAKAVGAELIRYKNNDMESLEHSLSKIPLDAGKLIVSDGVFSMSGIVANVPQIASLAKKYNARVLIDEAHGFGVVGATGRGTCELFNLKPQKDVDLLMGTFSKSFASLGGFVGGSAKIIDFIKHNAMSFIFSASMPPANTAAALASLEIIKREPERIARLQEIGDYMRKGFRTLGFEIIESTTPIIPVLVRDDFLTCTFWRRLFEEGVYTNTVVSPAVPPGMQLIRTSYIATTKQAQLDFILEKFEKAGKELGLIS